MIRGIHHTAISTPDLERALAFYRDLLGFELILNAAWPKGAELMDRITGLRDSASKFAMLRKGNALLELFEYESPVPKTGDPERPVNDHGITHMCLDVNDLDFEYERLKAAGMRFHSPPVDLGASRCVYGRDPDGNVLELLELESADHPLALPRSG